MAKETKPDMSCARVKQYKSSDIGAAERHNERKNTDYENINVVPERIGMNVHYRSPTGSYMDMFREMEAHGTLSTRGLRQDATLFDEIIIDVNTMYFERNGGYEYAKKFYEEAYHFLEKKFGSEYVVSAVMHADEINNFNRNDGVFTAFCCSYVLCRRYGLDTKDFNFRFVPDRCKDMDAEAMRSELAKIRSCANRIYGDMTHHLEKAQKSQTQEVR